MVIMVEWNWYEHRSKEEHKMAAGLGEGVRELSLVLQYYGIHCLHWVVTMSVHFTGLTLVEVAIQAVCGSIT